MNAHPRVMVVEAVTTTVARATLVVEAVAEPARTRTRSQVLAGTGTPLEGEKLPGE